MEKIRTIIVDDEAFARNILKKLVELNCPELELVGEAADNSSAFDIINSQHPDLVFLDIHLADDNSFNLFNRFDKITFDIIFTSAHSEYGVSAFKVNAIDYLLKPIDSDDLEASVQKVIKKRTVNIKNDPVENKTIAVHINDSVEYISLEQIVSFIAQNNYTEINTKDGRKVLSSKNLGMIEEELWGSTSFIRIHRNAIVNSKYIISYSKSLPCFVNMIDGNTFEISRRKRTEVLSLLKNHKLI